MKLFLLASCLKEGSSSGKILIRSGKHGSVSFGWSCMELLLSACVKVDLSSGKHDSARRG